MQHALHVATTPGQRANDLAIVGRELALSSTDDVALHDGGWDSRVYLVDGGEAVFKFPRTPEAGEHYACEAAALRLLAERDLPVVTPRLRWTDPETSFLGYEGIPGTVLLDVLPSIPEAEKERIGRTVGEFVEIMHGLELPEAPAVPLADELQHYVEKFEFAADLLGSKLKAHEFDNLKRFIHESFPRGMLRLGDDRRLCHGDLGPWNIILGPSGDIGVIDLGDVGYFDASKDFYGQDLTYQRAALDTYGADDHLRDKAALRRQAFPVLDLPYLISKQDDAQIDVCIDDLRRLGALVRSTR